MKPDERVIQRIQARWAKHLHGVAEQQYISRQVMLGLLDKAVADIKTLLEMAERAE